MTKRQIREEIRKELDKILKLYESSYGIDFEKSMKNWYEQQIEDVEDGFDDYSYGFKNISQVKKHYNGFLNIVKKFYGTIKNLNMEEDEFPDKKVKLVGKVKYPVGDAADVFYTDGDILYHTIEGRDTMAAGYVARIEKK